MSTSSRPQGHRTTTILGRDRTPGQRLRHTDQLSELGVEITASRLRVLAHPARLRIIRRLDRRTSTIAALADELGLDERQVRSHVALLCRAGVVIALDSPGAPGFRLADWPSLWLVDQFAGRLRRHADCFDTTEDGAGEAVSCR